jgi:hypothetical protein
MIEYLTTDVANGHRFVRDHKQHVRSLIDEGVRASLVAGCARCKLFDRRIADNRRAHTVRRHEFQEHAVLRTSSLRLSCAADGGYLAPKPSHHQRHLVQRKTHITIGGLRHSDPIFQRGLLTS